MSNTSIHEHNGVRFSVQAVRHGDVFSGHFKLLEADVHAEGYDDSYRPTTDNAWATETEALTYATEAAHHAIEGIPPFTGRPK